MTMRIIHLSDLHFGTERDGILEYLLQEIAALRPTVIVISGDLTQRARRNQFLAARAFIQRLSVNTLCVPGNHDISLYNWLERFAFPFAKYKRYIHPALCAHYIKDDVAILGINSVTPFKPMGGYVTDQQLHLVKEFFNSVPQKIKIVTMHHNLIKSERHKIINDAEKIIDVFAACNVDLVLSGHIHFAHIERLTLNKSPGPMYIITAGTPISKRTLAPNSFNIIDIENMQFRLTVKSVQNNQYITSSEEIYSL